MIFPDSKISIYIVMTKLQIISVKKTKGEVNRSFKYEYAYFLSDLSHQKRIKFNFIWEVRPITVWQKRKLTRDLEWFHLTEKCLYRHMNSFKSFNIFCILNKWKLTKRHIFFILAAEIKM